MSIIDDKGAVDSSPQARQIMGLLDDQIALSRRLASFSSLKTAETNNPPEVQAGFFIS